jgi:hypothetical protein
MFHPTLPRTQYYEILLRISDREIYGSALRHAKSLLCVRLHCMPNEMECVPQQAQVEGLQYWGRQIYWSVHWCTHPATKYYECMAHPLRVDCTTPWGAPRICAPGAHFSLKNQRGTHPRKKCSLDVDTRLVGQTDVGIPDKLVLKLGLPIFTEESQKEKK